MKETVVPEMGNKRGADKECGGGDELSFLSKFT